MINDKYLLSLPTNSVLTLNFYSYGNFSDSHKKA